MDSGEVHSAMAEDLSERSDSSESSSSGGTSSADGPAEPIATLPSFHPYKSFEEMKLDDAAAVAVRGFGEYAGRHADGSDLPMALDKPKDYAVQRSDAPSLDEPSAGIFRGGLCKELQSQKEAMYSFCREIQEMRQKSLHAAAAAAGKDLELIKTYGLPLERIKDFGGLARIGGIGLDRHRPAALHGESPEAELQQLQSRSSGAHQAEASLAFERLRHAHPLFQAAGDGGAAAPGQFGHAQQEQQQQQQQHLQQHHHNAVTQITQMQHVGSPHQQHQQQPKSFTIDAILGLRGAGQREKHQRHHQYRKHQGQEGTTRSLSGNSCPNGSNGASNTSGAGGKLKRVRTIFTAEQLERLEGEFARQQYMVGPERLYLAHALRLTEAQVKVWFQNRRIKWRKLNHEQQSQRLHELHQTTGMSVTERDDSNENAGDW